MVTFIIIVDTKNVTEKNLYTGAITFSECYSVTLLSNFDGSLFCVSSQNNIMLVPGNDSFVSIPANKIIDE